MSVLYILANETRDWRTEISFYFNKYCILHRCTRKLTLCARYDATKWCILYMIWTNTTDKQQQQQKNKKNSCLAVKMSAKNMRFNIRDAFGWAICSADSFFLRVSCLYMDLLLLLACLRLGKVTLECNMNIFLILFSFHFILFHFISLNDRRCQDNVMLLLFLCHAKNVCLQQDDDDNIGLHMIVVGFLCVTSIWQ